MIQSPVQTQRVQIKNNSVECKTIYTLVDKLAITFERWGISRPLLPEASSICGKNIMTRGECALVGTHTKRIQFS